MSGSRAEHRLGRALASALALAVFLAGCTSSSPPKAAGPAPSGPIGATSVITAQPTAPTTEAPQTFTVGTAKVPLIQIYDGPGQGEPTRSLPNPNPYYGTPRVLLVKEQQGEWLHVMLPMRPNGTTGWINRSDVDLAQHNWRMVVELGAHKLTVYEGKEVFLEEPVGVGTGATPTPGGLFYTTELLIPVGQPQYGPYAYGMSGYSEVWYEFAGGDGQFGLHGTNDPSSVGRDVSNGCLRVSNDTITRLAEKLPIGVPVEIRA
jgi:lipoprotein-anchoring transpeptidase ErfK/SrfK